MRGDMLILTAATCLYNDFRQIVPAGDIIVITEIFSEPFGPRLSVALVIHHLGPFYMMIHDYDEISFLNP